MSDQPSDGVKFGEVPDLLRQILARLDGLDASVSRIETVLVRQGKQIDRIETRLNRIEDSAYRAGIGRSSGLPIAAKPGGCMMARRDVNEAAHQTIQAVISRTEPAKPAKNLAAVALGKLGGLKGGKARAAKLTPEQRREIALKGARARWANRARAEA